MTAERAAIAVAASMMSAVFTIEPASPRHAGAVARHEQCSSPRVAAGDSRDRQYVAPMINEHSRLHKPGGRPRIVGVCGLVPIGMLAMLAFEPVMSIRHLAGTMA